MQTSLTTVQNSSTITEGKVFWKQHSELQKSSGLSRVEYCREHKLNYHRFGYWLKKYSHTAASSSSLITVKIKPEKPSENKIMLCTLNLSNGRTLCIYDQQALALILEKLS